MCGIAKAKIQTRIERVFAGPGEGTIRHVNPQASQARGGNENEQ
jgi:hypothetical protein